MIFNQPRSRSSRRRFRSRRFPILPVSSFQQLESRCLLAGNVTAILRGQNAFIAGDGDGNSVSVEIEGGNVVVRGLNGTTINGSSDDFVMVTGGAGIAGSLSVDLGAGDDSFNLNGVPVGHNVVINGNDGADQIAISNGAALSRHLSVNGGRGDDVVSVQDASVSGNVFLQGLDGNDTLIVSGTSVGGSLTIDGSRGDDDVVVDDSTVFRNARIIGWKGNDDVVVRDTSIGGRLVVAGHSGNDLIMVDSSSVGGGSRIVGNTGSDNIVVQGGSQFSGRNRIVGGVGGDSLEIEAGSSVRRLRSRRFEGGTVDANLIATRITDTTTGALSAAESAVASFNQTATLSLSVSDATIDEDAGDGAATVTATLSAAVDEDVVVTLASSNSARLEVQDTTVTIPAGSTSVAVPLDPQDNSDADGDAAITISATTASVGNASVDVTVTDDDAPANSAVTLTASASEVVEDTGNASTVGSANQLSFSIVRQTATADAATFSLDYRFSDGSDASAFVSGPSEVTIAANETTFDYQISTVPDGNVRTLEEITVTAENSTLGTTTSTFTLVDNDLAELDVSFSVPTAGESVGGVTLTVSRNTDTTSALSVILTSSNAARANFDGNVSTTVEIPAGASSVTQTFNIVDDDLDNGDSNIAVTATASGFGTGSSTIEITDDDDPALTVSLSGSGTVSETAGSAALTGTVFRNTTDLSSELTVLLTTDDDRLSAPATVTIPASQDSVQFSLDVIDNDVVDDSNGVATVTATTGGFTDGTASVNIANDDIASFSISPSLINVDEDAGTAQVTLTRNSSAELQEVGLFYSDTSLVLGPSTVTFAAGANIVTFNVNIQDNDSLEDNADVTIRATSGTSTPVEATVRIANDDTLELTTDFSSNAFVESVNSFVTREDTITITGQTRPGAVVQVDTDGDTVFDEGSAVADGSGNYSVTVGLIHNDSNDGLNPVQVRAVVAESSSITTSDVTNIHRAIGTVLRFQTNQDIDADGTDDFYDVELLDDDAPLTVANFLSYVNDGSFENNIVHRSPPNFVIQGGGFRVDNGTVTRITTKAPIDEEFSAENSNVRGTLSMAHAGHLTGTSQWFVNVVDNVGLDTNVDGNGQSAPHTVFGRVIGGGMSVVDAINQISVADLSLVTGQSALQQTPLRQSPFTALTGTISLTEDSDTLVGTGTLFTTELEVGDVIDVFGSQVFVTSIVSDTEIVIDVEASRDEQGLNISRVDSPPDENYLIFSNIGEILDSI